MNIPTPAQVTRNRTARLLREAKTPRYTSESTPAPAERDHLVMVEVVDCDGRGRYWSGPFQERQIKGVSLEYERMGAKISDVDCSAKCWCQA